MSDIKEFVERLRELDARIGSPTAYEAADALEALAGERDSMTVLIADLVKLVPLRDTISASATGETLVSYFRERLSRAEAAEAEVARLRKEQKK